jgi:S1-C subfamily serine protease
VFDPPGALRLRHLTGPQRGATVVLRPPRCRIGRSRSNDIIIADYDGAEASGHHAEALRRDGQWFIHDLQSTNGTRLNGTIVTRAPFGPGDRLRFGDIECEVRRGRFYPMVAATAAVLLAAIAGVLMMRASSSSFERVAGRVAQSAFVVALDGERGRQIVGTAFVVGDRLLATNAHVAKRLEPSVSGSNAAVVVIRSDEAQPHRVTAVHVSSRWRDGSIEDDVALLRVADLPADAKVMVLADSATLASLARGMSLATFGFPAMSTDPSRPRGRLSVDVLGDVRDQRYLAVGLRIAPGMSGSPIFLPNGTVVGLVAGGDFAEAPSGEILPTGTNANWGISIVPLQQLLRECEALPPR